MGTYDAYEAVERKGFSPLVVIGLVVLALFGFLVKMAIGLLPEIRSTTQSNAAMMAAKDAENAVVIVSQSDPNKVMPKELAPFFASSVLAWEDEILDWADDFDLDPNLVATVMQIESCGNPQAVSVANAQGLFQVMPFHFLAGEKMQDPDTNAKRGLSYLKEALEYHDGNVRLALAAYNGGLTTSTWDEIYWPQETQRYVYWGVQMYADASADADESERFEEWYAVGYPLCEASMAIGYSK